MVGSIQLPILQIVPQSQPQSPSSCPYLVSICLFSVSCLYLMQIKSSISFFQISHICINIQCIFKKCFYIGVQLINGEGNGSPLQYSCLENPMDGGAWQAAVHGVAEGRTRLRDFTFPFHFHALEKEMATHSSVLAWRIPGMGEPGGLPSMGSHRVGHD